MNNDRGSYPEYNQKAPFKKVLSGLSGLIDSRKCSNGSGAIFEPEFGGHRIDFQLSQNAGSRAFDLSQDFTEKTIFPAPLQAYNPQQTPPDFAKAEKHRIAHRVGPIHFRSESDEICESTGMPVNYQRVSLGSPLSAVYHLGPVVPMYMHFIRQLTIIIFFFCSIPITICALQKKFLVPDYFGFIDTLMSDQRQLMTLIIAPLSIFLLLTILLYCFRRSQKNMKLACKKLALTPSDYTIMCYNMGYAYNPEEVSEFFTRKVLLGYNLDVVKTVITYDIEDYSNKIRKLDQCLKSKKELSKLGVKDQNVLDEQINRIDNYIYQVRKARPKHQGLQRTGLCFVTFSTKQEAKSVRRRYEMSFFEKISVWFMHKCMEEFPEHFFKDQYIQVQKAPELYEIVWENLSCNSSRFLIGLLNFIALPGIITLTLIATYFIKKSETLHPQGSYLIAVIIFFTNEILKFTIRLLIRYEKFKTITELQISLGYRITITQFINLTAPLLITNILLLSKHFPELSFDALIIALINFTLPLIIRLINFPFIYKRFQARKIRQQGYTCPLTQEEANRIFEDPEFQVWLLYPTIITTFLFTCFFCPISPAVPFLAFITLFLLYWVDKYNLFRRSLIPGNLRSELAEAMFEFLDFGLFLLTLGTYTLFQFAKNESAAADDIVGYEILCTFAIVVSSIYMVLPHKRLSRSCFNNTKSLTRRDAILYQQAAEYLQNDYQTVNPVSLDHPGEPKDFKVVYRETASEMGELKTIQEAPELLSIFDYARKRPSLEKIWTGSYKGLSNPYYFFSQSYGYGLLPMGVTLTQEVKEDDREIGLHTPFLGKGTKETEIFDMVKSNQSISKEPLIIDGSLLQNSKGRTSQKGNSIMNDLKMMPSFTGGEERKPDDSFGQGASGNFSGSFGAGFGSGFEKVNKEDNNSFTPFNHSVSPIDNQDISPILRNRTGSLKFEEQVNESKEEK